MESKTKGIKSMRQNRSSKIPTYDCPNCHCKRYSPCRCMKKAGVEVQVAQVTEVTEVAKEI